MFPIYLAVNKIQNQRYHIEDRRKTEELTSKRGHILGPQKDQRDKN